MHAPAFERCGAAALPAGAEVVVKSDLTLGELFSATLTSISTPNGSWNQRPLESKPRGASSSRMPCSSTRRFSGSKSSSKRPKERKLSFFALPSLSVAQRCGEPRV